MTPRLPLHLAFSAMGVLPPSCSWASNTGILYPHTCSEGEEGGGGVCLRLFGTVVLRREGRGTKTSVSGGDVLYVCIFSLSLIISLYTHTGRGRCIMAWASGVPSCVYVYVCDVPGFLREPWHGRGQPSSAPCLFWVDFCLAAMPQCVLCAVVGLLLCLMAGLQVWAGPWPPPFLHVCVCVACGPAPFSLTQ